MAIRYSGDVEIRIRRRGGHYVAQVRMPGDRGIAEVEAGEIGLGPEALLGNNSRLESPETYDRVAYQAIRTAEEALGRELPVEREGSTLIVRRRFQAPCPILRRR